MSEHQGSLTKGLLVALLTPLALLILVGLVLGSQILRMAEDSEWVDHTDKVIAKTNQVQSEIVDQETGLRGFLLSRDPMFLEPYEKARPMERIAQLRAMIVDNPEQVQRVDELRDRYKTWKQHADEQLHQGVPDAKFVVSGMLERKNHMDAVRAALQNLSEAETALRQSRADAAAASIVRARILFVGLLALTALVLAFLSRRQMISVAQTYGAALSRERNTRAEMEDEQWIRSGQVTLSNKIQGDLSLSDLGLRVLETLAEYTGARVGAFFSAHALGWRRAAGYALDPRSEQDDGFGFGEGIIGQAALKQELVRLNDVPSKFLMLRSGTAEGPPAHVLIISGWAENKVHAVVELGFLEKPSSRTERLIERIGENVAIAVRSAEYRQRLRELLEESQQQTEELQTQQEELRVANEELQEQSALAREAHAELEARQAQLELTNTQLEEQTVQLRQAEQEISQKAAEVEQTSQYKSEFLANMSHELRTPLNSALILAKLLADNKPGNLTEEQIHFANTIYAAGNDLLALINDVLDLSKIEAGKLDIRVSSLSFPRLRDILVRMFEPLTREKGLAFEIDLASDLPEAIDTDGQRLEQILRNLLSNAVKFTDKGSVTLRMAKSGSQITFAVADTGIGIPSTQQSVIFDAFRQVDGASNRKYAGTGLGLSISRDLAHLLGGSISVTSEPGKGSVFTLTLPVVYVPKAEESSPAASRAFVPAKMESHPELGKVPARPPLVKARPKPVLTDDRDHLDRMKRTVLVIEDDLAFARILQDLARELEFQTIVATNADSGFNLAGEFLPSAIVLDMSLPDHSGLSVLDRLKRDPNTRHIPVHVVSGFDHQKAALAMGAVGYMLKPVNREELVDAFKTIEQRLSRDVRRLLIVEDDERQRESLTQLLGGKGVEIVGVGTANDALAALKANTFDCIVTDLSLPDVSGADLLEQMAANDSYSFPPVIVYTGRSLTANEEQRLRKYASSIVVKGARSPERLLDEVTLFLHQVESELPVERQRMLKQARDREAVFEGRQILVVEDDVRNIFALTSILEPKGAKVVIARNGREALEVLDKTADIDLVLMDIMMPEMDGLQATKEIRKRPSWAKLPIIALTAKAMRDDQERCLQAGANDYISKPLDVEMLLSLLRVWMPK